MKMEITKMTSRGQVVIPQEVREDMGIKEGERFIVYETDDSIVLKRIRNLEAARDVGEFERAFASVWKTAGSRGVGEKAVQEEIEKHRKDKHA